MSCVTEVSYLLFRGYVFYYQLCDFVLESNVALPELLVVGGTESSRTFHLHGARSQESLINRWFRQTHLLNGGVWLAFARQGNGFILRFPSMADFSVSADGREIGCYPQSATGQETLTHLLLDQVIPLVLSQQGELVLHGSAVAGPKGAIAFLGETGRGKSTLSASFCQQGFPLLTDDCLLLRSNGEEFRVFPSYPGLRLWPETRMALIGDSFEFAPVAHYTDKERIKQDSGPFQFCATPVPVDRLYVLAPPEDGVGTEYVHIRPVKPRDAFMELVNSSFRLDTDDRNGNRRAFEAIDEAVRALAVFRLAFPRDITFLPSVRAAVLEHVAGRH